jgi:hypothetical protein
MPGIGVSPSTGGWHRQAKRMQRSSTPSSRSRALVTGNRAARHTPQRPNSAVAQIHPSTGVFYAPPPPPNSSSSSFPIASRSRSDVTWM